MLFLFKLLLVAIEIYQGMLCVAFVDCTLVGSATGSLKDLRTVSQENTTNQTADVLVEDQLHCLWT